MEEQGTELGVETVGEAMEEEPHPEREETAGSSTGGVKTNDKKQQRVFFGER